MDSVQKRSARNLLRAARKLMNKKDTSKIVRSLSQDVEIRIVKNFRSHEIPDYINLSTSEFLSWWITSTGCKRKASNILLRYMKFKYNVDMPIDYRTLLKTPVKPVPKYVAPGSYIHVGVHRALYQLLSQAGPISPNAIKMQFFIDGLSISRSIKDTLWVIMVNIRNASNKRLTPKVIGAYYGETQPKNFNEFLWPFVMELLDILEQGISFNGSILKLQILNFVLDAKARVACKAVKSINGYEGCDVCLAEGDSIDDRMAFLNHEAALRNDRDYRARVYEDYHHMESVLEMLPIDMIDAFPLDYLHCVLLGVINWILGYLRNTPQMLSSQDYITIQERVKKCEETQPLEFQRGLRSFIDYLGLMKGTEFRQYLLFVAPLLLKGIIDEEKIGNLLKLHIASTIFSHKRFDKYYKEADELMRMFLQEFAEIYHPRHVVYVFHSLCHMKKFVDLYGPWDNFSTFEYETYNSTVKNLLQSKVMPLTQITNRIAEIYSAPQHNFKEKSYDIEVRGQLEDGSYSSLKYYDLTFKTNVVGQNFVLLKSGKAVMLKYIFEDPNTSKVMLIGSPFKYYSSVFDEVDTTRFNIFKCHQVFDDSVTFGVKDIDGKFWEMGIYQSSAKAYYPIYVEDGKSFSRVHNE